MKSTLYASHTPGQTSCLGIVDQHRTDSWFQFFAPSVLDFFEGRKNMKLAK